MENRNLKLISIVDTALGNIAVTKMEFTEEILQKAYGFKNQDEAFKVLRNAFKGRGDIIIKNDTDNKVIEIDKCFVPKNSIVKRNIERLKNNIINWIKRNETGKKYTYLVAYESLNTMYDLETINDLNTIIKTITENFNNISVTVDADIQVIRIVQDLTKCNCQDLVKDIKSKLHKDYDTYTYGIEQLTTDYNCVDLNTALECVRDGLKDIKTIHVTLSLESTPRLVVGFMDDEPLFRDSFKCAEPTTEDISEIKRADIDIQHIAMAGEFFLHSHLEEEEITEPYKDLLFLDIKYKISGGADTFLITANELLLTYGYVSQQQAYDDVNSELCHLRGVKFTLTVDGCLKVTRLNPVLKTDDGEAGTKQYHATAELKEEILASVERDNFILLHITEDELLDRYRFLNQTKAFETIQGWLKDISDVVIENDIRNKRVVITKNEDINKNGKHQSTKPTFYQSPDGCSVADWFPKLAINEIEGSVSETVRRVRTFNDSKDLIMHNYINSNRIKRYNYDIVFVLANTHFTTVDAFMVALRDAVNATAGIEIAVYDQTIQKLIVH